MKTEKSQVLPEAFFYVPIEYMELCATLCPNMVSALFLHFISIEYEIQTHRCRNANPPNMKVTSGLPFARHTTANG